MKIKFQIPHAVGPAFIVCLATLRPLTYTGVKVSIPIQQFGKVFTTHRMAEKTNKKLVVVPIPLPHRGVLTSFCLANFYAHLTSVAN